MKVSTIYIDNDETIQTSDEQDQPLNRPNIVSVPLLNGRFLVQFLRPGILDLLADLRRTHRVVLLTATIREIVRINNQSLGLGFADSEMICQEDYFRRAPSGAPYPIATSTDPFGILTDNHAPIESWAATKQRFLGIGPERYLRIPEYFKVWGAPEIAAAETQDILRQIRQLIARFES